MYPYQTPSAALPKGGSTVWIRVYWWQGPPVLATYDDAAFTFTIDATGLVVPAWAVSRWREPSP